MKQQEAAASRSFCSHWEGHCNAVYQFHAFQGDVVRGELQNNSGLGCHMYTGDT